MQKPGHQHSTSPTPQLTPSNTPKEHKVNGGHIICNHIDSIYSTYLLVVAGKADMTERKCIFQTNKNMLNPKPTLDIDSQTHTNTHIHTRNKLVVYTLHTPALTQNQPGSQ